MAEITQEKLRRLAPRAEEALERHKLHAAWLGVFDETLGVSAPAFIEAYDMARGVGKLRRTQVWSKHSSSAALLQELRGWANVVCMYIPADTRGDYGSNPGVPDDVISDVTELIKVVDIHEQKTGKTLSFSARMRTDLMEALAKAKLEWSASGQATASLSELRREAKAAADLFRTHLIAFRKALGNLLGRQHPDYQTLRGRVSAAAGEEEGEEDAGTSSDGSVAEVTTSAQLGVETSGE